MGQLRERLRAPRAFDIAQREQLLLDHLPHVHHIARRIHYRLPPQVPLEDLVHAGILGLMDAVQKFDPRRNVRLKHYAEFRIRGAILDSLREVDWGPRALRRKARKLEEAVSRCRARLGREPSEPEIAGELGISPKALNELRADLRGLNLSNLQNEEPSVPNRTGPATTAPMSDNDDPFECALREEMSGLLTRAMAELPSREREVLFLYHFRELSMKAIGVALGVGESRISQIRSAGLVHLRAALRLLMARKPLQLSNP